jgi:phage recombination protein Bet
MNELQTTQSKEIAMWDDQQALAEIKQVFAPKLTELEFNMFIGMGRATGLNPFLREIWAVKYNGDAQIFIGRDGYRKAAQAHPEYDYHQVDAVYENDKFKVVNGEPEHSYSLSNRGHLVGAYCTAKRRSGSRPVYVFVELREYTTGRSTWKDKPATMIKKVAESQCLRSCFQDLFGGTYGQEEMDSVTNKKQPVAENKEELIAKLKRNKKEPIDITPEAEEVEETGEVANPEQVKLIMDLVSEKGFSPARFDAALNHYEVETMGQLTKAQADDFIIKLKRA